MVSVEDVLRSRRRVAADNNRLGPVEGRTQGPYQVVAKICGRSKSPEGARKMAAYVGRVRMEDRDTGVYGKVAVMDGYGLPVQPENVVERIGEWSLVPEKDNLSVLARHVGEEQAEALPARERLHAQQVVHLTWSVDGTQEPTGDLTTARLEETTLAVIDELLSAEGFESLWGVHPGDLDHPDSMQANASARDMEGGASGEHLAPAGNSHVHILVPFEGAESRLQVNHDFLDRFRHGLQRHGREVGLNLVAERREDREEVRECILAGEEPLRLNSSSATLRGATGDLKRRAPAWWATYGTAMDERTQRMNDMWNLAAEIAEREGISRTKAIRPLMEEPVKLPFTIFGRRAGKRREAQSMPPEGGEALLDAVKDSFHDPVNAVNTYWDLALDGKYQDASGNWKLPNKALSDWYMKHQPKAFGDLRPASLNHRFNPKLKIALHETLPGMSAPVLPHLRAQGREVDAVSESQKLSKALGVLETRVRDELGDKDAAARVGRLASSVIAASENRAAAQKKGRRKPSRGRTRE